MKKSPSLLLAFLISISLWSQQSHEKVSKRLHKLMEKELKKADIHNVYLSVYSPSKDFNWHAAKGQFQDGREVTTDHPYYTASIGKTFTATAIAILVDDGILNFEDPISKYLSKDVMENLHVLNQVDYGDSIQIKHLLQHTSGLADYFSEETVDGSPTLFELILKEPNKVWRPEELINFSKAHFQPSFTPGSGYAYTDTEYVLLGLIIEQLSGLAFHDFLTKHIFQPLQLQYTYLNLATNPQQADVQMAEMYFDEEEISSYKSLSADWAGGAIVSTGKELIHFHRALLSEQLVSEEVLNEMQNWTAESKGMSYGFGLRKINFKDLSAVLPNWEVIGHSGLNGTLMYYCPDLDLYLAGTLNQLEASKASVILMVKVLMACKKL